MANLPKPWIVDYSSNSRSSCKTCEEPINKDVLRIGRRVASPYYDGFMTTWNHATCFPKFRHPFQALHEVEGVDELRWKDQEIILNCIGRPGQGSGGSTPDLSSNEFSIENAKSSHATCKSCNAKIVKGEVRISSLPKTDQSKKRREARAWHHAKCFVGRGLCTSSMEKMPGWDKLTDENKESVQSIAKPYIQKSNEEKHRPKRDSKKRKVDDGEALSRKKPNTRSENLDINLREGSSAEDRELELKLKKQSDALWTIIDDLGKHVKTTELRKMLEANDQKRKGSASVLRARCAERMLFGALGKCPICEGRLEYFDAHYVCRGNISQWSKCTFSTTNPERLKGKWNIPENINNKYLSKWLASRKEKDLSRIFRPNSSQQPSQRSETEFLKGMAVAIAGNLEESREWETKLHEAGGRVMNTLKEDAHCLVINESEIEKCKTQIENATRMEVPVVGESFLVDCFKKKEMLKVDVYRIKKIEDEYLNNVKRRGRDSVHVSSGLQETGRIFKEGKSFYTITLNRCDLSSNSNSYYILQIIEVEDNSTPGDDVHVFRKWDRVGNDDVVRRKLQKMQKSEAVSLFKEMFLKHTGNEWEDWVNKGTFKKKANKYFLLDLDYGVDNPEEANISQRTARERSKLDDRVLDLMDMLFDPKIYRAALKELDIRMPVMPLGKLRESHIRKGFEVLREVEDVIKRNEPDVGLKERQLVDASSHFFTLIPTVNPRVIRDLDYLKLKNRMLDELLEMEKAPKFMRFEIKDDDPFYANYKKLNCDISPLPRDSSDYKLIERYLKKTHAPTHAWELELEDAYRIDREGERDAYMPRKSNLKNCMLLWHGSRVTNFLGILSTGLRIAPPEAPATGYMFGKGIYLADLASKSSKYCNASNEYAMGLLLLSEVALGEVHEIEKAEYMEEAPKGKDSTKGVGMYKYSTEYEPWGDDVIVPCGGLDLESGIPSKVEKDYLKYNEYIVYHTDQVKLQFLLKVRFHYKKTSKQAGISDVKSS